MPLTIRDQSGCLNIFGGIFVLSGTAALAFLLLTDEPVTLWQGVVVVAIGLAHIAGGAWLMSQSPPRRVEIDVDKKQLIVRTRRLRARETKVYEASDLAGGRIVEDRDSDGDPIFTAKVMTKSSQWIPLTSTPRITRDEAERDLQLVYASLLGNKSADPGVSDS